MSVTIIIDFDWLKSIAIHIAVYIFFCTILKTFKAIPIGRIKKRNCYLVLLFSS